MGVGGTSRPLRRRSDQAVGEKADIISSVSKRSLEVRDLDETVTREEVVAAHRWPTLDCLIGRRVPPVVRI